MVKIKIKALTVNRAYQGRRFSTPELKEYKRSLGFLLPRVDVPKGKLSIRYEFGVSSPASDLDNCVKAFQDCLSEQYGFNDREIYRAEMEKKMVKKNGEYIAFEISPFKEEKKLSAKNVTPELRESWRKGKQGIC